MMFRLPIIPVLALAFTGWAMVLFPCSRAIAEESGGRLDDRRSVEQCLALTAANRTALASLRGFDLPQAATAEAQIKAVQRDAAHAAESCIGVIARPCAGPEGSAGGTEQIACVNRELDVWDGRLNDAYRRVIGQADPDVRLRFVKVQRAWLAWRDASCAQPNVVFQGSMAAPMQAQCLLEATARQAIWLENWETR